MAAACAPAWLHPVFGPGEDRNRYRRSQIIAPQKTLHPVFGPGEDRNIRVGDEGRIDVVAAPGLRTG